MKIPLFHLSLLSLGSAFSSLTYTTDVHAKTVQSSHVGTWQNKDEDGDGVLDDQDDYPFDADKTTITVVQEEEFNNNNDVATIVPEGLRDPHFIQRPLFDN
ncbi:hypothetical protein I6F40_09255 [Pseudoalteromonas sp. SWXJ133]|uniref:hypothetical protein n=1 Tax=Pseudoalteromonas sp. SWXJ133 TaxID=2792069 RepID=UPI0018CEBFE8|nr:hypothetical protein [Pseudoalteromonas sp. SWXJ133]MBH0020526.1 hypothetical protein [Pseudoalteromonas sp. SWXJ133]